MYICRSFYVFSSWFNYNNLLISHSNGTCSLSLYYECTYCRQSGDWELDFYDFSFWRDVSGIGKWRRDPDWLQDREKDSRQWRRHCDFPFSRRTTKASCRDPSVILHACLVYIFYVICMKMLLEGPPVKRRMTTHVVWGFQKFSIFNSRPCYTHYNCTLNLKELI